MMTPSDFIRFQRSCNRADIVCSNLHFKGRKRLQTNSNDSYYELTLKKAKIYMLASKHRTSLETSDKKMWEAFELETTN
jgi:hypothetical protein